MDLLTRFAMEVESPLFLSPEREPRMEKCGVTAVVMKNGESAAPIAARYQREIEHRGMEAAGIATNSADGIVTYTALGKVSDILPEDFDYEAQGLTGSAAIGHNRWTTTTGEMKDSIQGAQPMAMVLNGLTYIVSYNGNIPEIERDILRSRIPQEHANPYNYDTVDILQALSTAPGETVPEQVRNALEGVNMAYAFTFAKNEKGKPNDDVYGIRSPSGTWGLWVGEAEDHYVIASETRVNKDISNWQAIKPGELVRVSPDGVTSMQLFKPLAAGTFICGPSIHYFGRPDSLMTEDKLIGDYRYDVGLKLAKDCPIDADIIGIIPDSSRWFGKGYADGMNSPLTEVLQKNGGRTYILPTAEQRHEAISKKFTVLNPDSIVGKKVVLVDDTVVEGKSTGGDIDAETDKKRHERRGVVGQIFDAGASEVHLVIAYPKIVRGCDQGVVIHEEALVANELLPDGTYRIRTDEEVGDRLGATSIQYLSIASYIDSTEEVYGEGQNMCLYCIGGEHPRETIARSTETYIPVSSITVFESAAADGGL